MPESLLGLDRVEGEVEAVLGALGEIRRAWREQDSGCVSFHLTTREGDFFVKHACEERAVPSLLRAERLAAAIRHPALAPLRCALPAERGRVLVYDLVPGEVLNDYTAFPGETGRRDPASAHSRFRALAADTICELLDTVYDVHLRLAELGFVAVDFYDGAVIYDFARSRTYLCDLDEYRPGPFVLMSDRLPGSTRFMAPEEFERGATIDQVTNVFTLGRTAFELLSDGTPEAWKGSPDQLEVARRATSSEREERYRSVATFVEAWRRA